MLIGNKLRLIRKERGLTLKDVANNADISLPFLSDIERGDANPSMGTLEKLAAFYGLQVAELLNNTENTAVEKIYPQSLLELQKEKGFDTDWLNTLNAIQYRGNQPKTKDEWELVYLNLKHLDKRNDK